MALGKTALMLMVALAVPRAAGALGLGEIHVDSALNEPLAAQIDIVGATAEERAETRQWQRRVELNITENIYNGFRYAEGFDLFNHHNLYIQESLDDVANVGDGVPVPITASKGGIGNNGGANDERRFGQFSLSVNF